MVLSGNHRSSFAVSFSALLRKRPVGPITLRRGRRIFNYQLSIFHFPLSIYPLPFGEIREGASYISYTLMLRE